jgi:hypothetical protein
MKFEINMFILAWFVTSCNCGQVVQIVVMNCWIQHLWLIYNMAICHLQSWVSYWVTNIIVNVVVYNGLCEYYTCFHCN